MPAGISSLGLEHELAVGPGEDLQKLGLDLVDQRALQVVRRQGAHLDQDLPLLALLLLHARDGGRERLAGDELLLQQDLPQALTEKVRADRDRIAVGEEDDLLGVVAQQQQRAAGARGVEPLEHARQRRPLERPGERRLDRILDQRLGGPLDVAPFALLRGIVQAGPSPPA